MWNGLDNYGCAWGNSGRFLVFFWSFRWFRLCFRSIFVWLCTCLGLSGLDLQQELAKANISRSPSFSSLIAVIFPYVSGLSRQERWSFSLTKPFDHKDLLDAIQQGIARDRRARHGRRDVPLHGFEEIAVI